MAAEATREEVLAAEPAEGLAALLDLPTGGIAAGVELPPLWHWVYLLERRAQRDLGPDGHPMSGVPAPPGPGRRRMFAGGRVLHVRPLVLGRPAVRRTRLLSTQAKAGRTGPLTFATVRSEIHQDGRLAVVDDQDIVYRAPGGSLPPAEPGPGPVADPPRLDLDVDARLLFRFSALTYNAHRIHYDREFVAQEGYDDLVVHGPLQALMIAELFRRHGVELRGRELGYRLVAPMTGAQRLTVTGDLAGAEPTADVFGAAGSVTATGRLRAPG
ncbi:mesaconyl-C4 CoA hydratase [Nocardioides iriomotensis]|uniref:Mesaconyl-C4 CoA hydratase n=1 Tax=Nocardioides iriomotensis TaxID=715784 RepID=A0A4Q5J5B6_9ACTN|nr:mesaconyl-C4 CoA hydratase [Nocardioides iriomotensis]